MAESPSERAARLRQIAPIGGLVTRSRHDPHEYTRAATAASLTALDRRLLAEIDPDGKLPEAEREARLVARRRAHWRQMAYRAAVARNKKRAQKTAGRA